MGFSFAVFLFIVYKLLVGLKDAISKEENPEVSGMLNQVCLATVVSWCTYPVVYLFPFFNIGGAQAVVAIQCGYCVSDVISKCGVGFLIYNITMAKSTALQKGALLAWATWILRTFQRFSVYMPLARPYRSLL